MNIIKRQIKLTLENDEIILTDYNKFIGISQEDLFKLCNGKKIKKVDFI